MDGPLFARPSLGPMLVKVTRMGPRLQGQYHVDVNYKKTFGPGAWL